MKVLFIFLLVMGLCVSVYAAPVTHGGFSYTPIGYTDTNADDASTISNETDTVVWTPASGQKIVLMGLAYNSGVASTVRIENGSTIVGPPANIAASGLLVVTSFSPIWQGEDDETLTYTTTGAGGVHSIMLWGYETD